MKTTKIDEYDIIIFDCDGVLIDINLLKCEAFGKAVEGYPVEIINEFVQYCKKTFGVSRYVKFKEFLINFAREPFQEDKYKLLIRNYSDICKETYDYAALTPGTKELLVELYRKNKKLYVASGSDEQELKEVFYKRDLDKYFDGVYGSPNTKLECTIQILSSNSDQRAVFIGDAISDMNTAMSLNIDFIYMSEYTVQTQEQDLICREGAKLVINNLGDLFTIQVQL